MPVNFTVEMPYEPQVSVNRAYGQKPGGGKYLRRLADGWKTVLRVRTMRAIEQAGISLPLAREARLIINLDAKFPAQRGRKPDPDNFLKLAQDAIAAGFGLDDHICLARARSAEHGCAGGGLLAYEVEVVPSGAMKYAEK